VEPPAPTLRPDRTVEAVDGHIQIPLILRFDPETVQAEIIFDRAAQTHLDLAYFWKYYPGMLSVDVLDLNTDEKEVTLRIIFANPLEDQLRDVRMIFIPESPVHPQTFDGWSIRAGAEIENPDTYFIFGEDSDLHAVESHASVMREIVFSYSPPFTEKITPFVLDAVVNNNTAEPYEFGATDQTGRLFQVAISDWQDDISWVELDTGPLNLPAPLQLTKFGNENIWVTSVPDIDNGIYTLRLTAGSPELPGELGEGDDAVAVHFIEFSWPPDEPVIPLQDGNGIYIYTFIDPDTNTAPTDVIAWINKFQNEMGGDYLIMEYGEICNSGYLSMHSWVPIYIEWLDLYAPDLPIYLNFDNLGFQPVHIDPCHHLPENYTEKFFENLQDSIRGQILEDPAFDSVKGFHFDIEIFPGQYTEDNLFEIYGRYSDFLARLHMEPDFGGRNITLYDFDHHPVRDVPSLAYLCTTDAFYGEAYFSRFSFQWDPSEYETGFWRLEKILATYDAWAEQYGRPWHPIPGTFSGWYDGYTDTLLNFTLCPDHRLVIIDDFCFGKGLINTINEWDVVRAHDVHGMWVEKVILELDTGEKIFPSNGFAVYQMGDGDRETLSDDYVFCRTAYSMSRAYRIIDEHDDALSGGSVVFRYENNQDWKASALVNPLGRGDITAVSGHVMFGDGLNLQLHPELWGGITIELVEPLTPEITENPSYMKSIDLVGVEDGSYIFPDLPRAVVTIRAFADGWSSDPVTINLTENYAYRENVDLIINPI